MLFSYFLKFYSIWNQSKPDISTKPVLNNGIKGGAKVGDEDKDQKEGGDEDKDKKDDENDKKDDKETEVNDDLFIPNIFYKRKTADYMHYMKFEAFNWIFHSSFLTLDALALWVHYKGEYEIEGIAPTEFVSAVYIMMGSHFLILIVYSYQMANEHTDKVRLHIMPKKITWP